MNRSDRLCLYAVSFAFGFMSAAITSSRPLISLFARQLGAETATIGLIISLFGLIPLFIAIPTGLAVDRLGPRVVGLVGSIGLALAHALIALEPSLTSMVVSQLLTGFFHLLLLLAAQTLATNVGGSANRGTTMATFMTIGALGQLVGPALGGLIADQFGYASAFWLGTILSLMATISFLVVPGTLGHAPHGSSDLLLEPSGFKAIPKLLRNPAVLVAIVSSFSLIFTVGVWEAFFPIYLDDLGYSISAVGLLLSVRAAALVSARFFMNGLTALVGGRFRLLMASMLVGAVTVGLTPLITTTLLLGVVAVLAGLSSGLVFPLGLIAVADGTSIHERGLAMGLRLTGNRLAHLTNPLLFGYIAQAFTLGTSFFVGGFLLLLVTLLALPFGRAYPDSGRQRPSDVLPLK